MKRFSILCLVLLVLSPTLAQGQCVVGLAGEPNGTSTVAYPVAGEVYSVYVLLDWEGLADAVSYSLHFPGLGVSYFMISAVYGPDGGGINIQTVNGENVGLGVCAVGFSQTVVVARYDLLVTQFIETSLRVGGNVDSHPDFPVISNCVGDLITCDIGSVFRFEGVPVESESFGAIKTLYTN